MPEPLKQLNNPPIVEAIFGITFKEPITKDKLDLFQETKFVKEAFPDFKPNISVEVSAKKEGLKATEKTEGYHLRSIDDKKKRLIQVKPSQVSYHNLSKYDGWDTMIVELKNLWVEFCKSVGDNELSQLSVRYINQIDLPLPFEKGFADYLKLIPIIPQGINSALNNFFLQITVPVVDNHVIATITETILGANPAEKKLKLLLDISVVQTGSFKCNQNEMWEVFTKLRLHKNDLFTKCITEKTLKLFD